MYLKSCPCAVECHSAAIPSSSTPSSYPHTPGCTVVDTAPVGHILITVAAIPRDGEFSGTTPCAPATRATIPNSANPPSRFIPQASIPEIATPTSITLTSPPLDSKQNGNN